MVIDLWLILNKFAYRPSEVAAFTVFILKKDQIKIKKRSSVVNRGFIIGEITLRPQIKIFWKIPCFTAFSWKLYAEFKYEKLVKRLNWLS